MDKEERDKKIREKIEQEEFIEMMQLQGVRRSIWEFLTQQKGFDLKEVEIDPQFKIVLSNCEASVSIDFIVNISSLSFMVIRCVQSAIESWERCVIAFSRAVKEYQIPYAVVTDGENARIYTMLTGSLVSDSINSLPTHQEAVEQMKDFKKIACPSTKLEKEKRIIYAFEGIKCPTARRDA
jgi:2-hydroxy-3-keto-5-methylthiopentenyl-1-phosphate phosphatase